MKTRERYKPIIPNFGAGILAECNGKLLLCRRSKHVDEPGVWSIPGGHIEEGESESQAAIREFREETGYNGRIKSLKPISTYKNYKTFGAELDDEFTPRLNYENDQHGWFSEDEIPAPVHPGIDYALSEKYKSQKQKNLFRACANGSDYDLCKGTSKKKWKSMDREFSKQD